MAIFKGTNGNDVLIGKEKGDKLYGYAGADQLYGLAGNDFLYGGAGNDQLYGGDGDDQLFGHGGNDILHYYTSQPDPISWTAPRNPGKDTLDGGDGYDIAVLEFANEKKSVSFTLNSKAGSTSTATVGGKAFVSVKNIESVTVYGGFGNDTIVGGKGHDVIYGGAGNDKLYGGAGNDTLSASGGTIDGGTGTDLAILNFSDQSKDVKFTLNSKAGSTSTATVGGKKTVSVKNIEEVTVIGGFGNDTIVGGKGNDIIYGGAGNDKLYGGAGDDHLYNSYLTPAMTPGAQEKDLLDGGAGTDTATLYFTSETKSVKFALNSKAGSTSTLTVGGKAVTSVKNIEIVNVYGGFGNDTIVGGKGNDTIYGGTGNDKLSGGAGNDTLSASGGTMDGGAGTDVAVLNFADQTKNVSFALNSKAGSTSTATVGGKKTLSVKNIEAVTINGGSGNDTLVGGKGNDTLSGGAGKNKLVGGAGNDQIYGSNYMYMDERGSLDTLTGGAGADTFIYTVTEKTVDTITDFSAAQKDRIDLSMINAKGGYGTDEAFVYIGAKSFSGAGGEARFKSGVLQVDVDGDKVADLSVKLTGVTSLKASSLIL